VDPHSASPAAPTPHSRRQAAVALLVLTGILVLAGCRMGAPTTDSTPQPRTGSSAFSTLDEAGVSLIRATKVARLDMSSGRLEKASVRVAQASYGPEINTRNSGKIALTIAAPNGEIRGETDRIRFNTTDKREDFSEVTYFLTAGSLDELSSLIRDGVERYGIDSVVAERWISSMERDPEDKSDYSVTSGTSTGLEVNYDLRYDGAKDIQVIIVHVWPLD
jgi:hypothetical protein